jgi:glutamate dehydrogenase (NAD(P)+)
MHVVKFLAERGARIVAISDSRGGRYNSGGLDVEQVFAHGKGSLVDYQEGEQLSNQQILELDVDILIPAAIGNVITAENAEQINARLIVEAANMPIDCQADSILRKRGIHVAPDILANAGGVTVSYLEWVQNHQHFQWSEQKVNEELEQRLATAWEAVRQKAKDENVDFRLAAYMVAVERVKQAIELRGF